MNKKNFNSKDIEKLIIGLANEKGITLNLKNQKANIDQVAATLQALSPNLITNELVNLIREQTQLIINEGLELPFSNHRILDDNGIVQIRDNAEIYLGSANLITGVSSAEVNKDSVRYEQKVLDMSKPLKWLMSSGVVSALKKYTSLKNTAIYANDEVKERLDALFYAVIADCFSTLNLYPWTAEETRYTEYEGTDELKIGYFRYLSIQKVIDKILSKDGIRGFNQPDENHVGEPTFRNKIKSSNKITIVIDAQILAEIKASRAAYLRDTKEEQNSNPWDAGIVEAYNFANLGITDCFAYVLTPAALNYGVVDLNGNTIFGTSLQIVETNSFNYDSVMLKQASKCKIIDGLTPEVILKAQKEFANKNKKTVKEIVKVEEAKEIVKVEEAKEIVKVEEAKEIVKVEEAKEIVKVEE